MSGPAHFGRRIVPSRVARVAVRLAGWTAAGGRAGVRLIDRVLRRQQGVFVFCTEPGCVLRASYGQARRGVQLDDGLVVRPGDPLLHVHFWNERLHEMTAGERSDLAWSIALANRLRYSFAELAAFCERDGACREVVAVHGEFGFMPRGRRVDGARVLARLGLELRPGEVPGLRFWRSAFWAQLYSWWLQWAFHPSSLRGKRFREMSRDEVWMSRARLRSLGAAAGRETEPAR